MKRTYEGTESACEAYERKKTKWIKGLKVGDVVCDCRYAHLRIVNIEFSKSLNKRFRDLLFDYLPFRLYLEANAFFSRNFPCLCPVYDAMLELTNGRKCSAKHCCDMPDHPWNHPKGTER